ncbi:Sec23-binding domain of Sec16-domain-containing protein [Sparassis latifolia]
MSTAGEAASLFSAADPGVDPFATVLGDDRADATAHSASSDEASGTRQSFVSYNKPQDISGLDSWHNAGAVSHGYSYGTPPLADSSVDYTSLAHQPQADSRYAHSGPHPSYEQAPSQNYTAYSPYGQSHQFYDPRAQNVQTFSSATLAPETTQPVTQVTYEPTGQSLSNDYRSLSPATQSSYNPYKPVRTTTPKQTVTPSTSPYAFGNSVRACQSPALVPAPAPASSTPAPPYRPKTFTAYDPPLPPPKHPHYTPSIHPHHIPPLEQPLHSSQRLLSPQSHPPSRATIMPPQNVGASNPYGNPMLRSGGSVLTEPLHHDTWEHLAVPSDRYAPAEHDQIRQLYGQDHNAPSIAEGGRAELNYIYSDTAPLAGTVDEAPYLTERTMSAPSYSAAVQAPPNGHVWSNDREQDTLIPQTHYLDNVGEAAPPPFPHRIGSSAASVYNRHNPDSHHRYDLVNTSVPSTSASHQWNGTTVSAAAECPPVHNGESVRQTSTAAHSPERAKSPGSASVRSWKSTACTDTLDRVHPVQRLFSPLIGTTSRSPPLVTAANRTTSSSSGSVKSLKGPSTTSADPYAPSSQETTTRRGRSISNGSAYSSTPSDPYVSSRNHRPQPSDSSSQASITLQYNGSLPLERGTTSRRPTLSHDRASGQVVTLSSPAHTVYAPSPSLLGTNDPLGRTSVRVPVISFGFGGRLVTCFHGSSSLHTGFDVALSSRPTTDIKFRVLHNVIPQSALDTSAAVYPGPLYADPGAPTAGLVRSGAATQTKTKKTSVMKYLDERADEISRGIGYLHHESPEGRRAEAKHTLMKVLKVMVEHDGHLCGSSQVDAAVRAALVPRMAAPCSSADVLSDSSSLVDMRAPSSDISSMPYPVLASSVQDANDPTLAVNTLRSSNLDKIQELLVRGDRRAACHYASDQRLWAHAMVIASSIDKDAWKEVATEFVRTELSSRDIGRSGEFSRSEHSKSVPSSGREALRVAYSLFAGQGPASVQELLPPKPLVHSAPTLQIPLSASSVTPISPNFPGSAEIMNLPVEVMSKWADTAAMIISNPMTAESSSTLTALGDQLAANQWFEAAHVCYLLSLQTSPLGGIGSSCRVILLGSPGPQASPIFAKDPDPIIFTEIAEFALSLATPAKGQDVFTGLPHLQPYRLVRAMCLAEMGHVQLATRYCEAISNSLSRNSPYINSTFVEQLKGLSDRLVAAPQTDKSGSWIGSKMSKPSLDSIGVWLEGRFTKFIAGEVDTSPRAEHTAETAHQRTFSGPFAHYSTISSTTSSTIPSPQQSKMDLREAANAPPFRTGSAAEWCSPPSTVQINRAASAMEYIRPINRTASPIPRVSSASAATNTFTDPSLYGQALKNGQSVDNVFRHDPNQSKVDQPNVVSDNTTVGQPEYGAWWGSSESSVPTPTASSFVRVSDSSSQSSQFISLMDDSSNSLTPVTAQQRSNLGRHDTWESFAEEDEDDLGLGNSGTAREKRASISDEQAGEPAHEAAGKSKFEAPEKPELKTSSSGSWFSRIWRRETTPAPIKANLGEQTSFYYDQELKRWVNKNANAETAKSAPPPPPSRAQTASPGRASGTFPTGSMPLPPPARPATANAIDLGAQLPPRRPPPRARSNLVPTDSEGGSAPSTPTSATISSAHGGGPPPLSSSRARMQAKRAVRSRYVDVFQQQTENT